jgi:hypothetical protein
MTTRMRWTNDGASLIGATPRSGAVLRSITDDAVSRGRRGRDQAQPALLCKISQNGSTGEWSGEDGEGRPLRVENGTAGLEIWSVPEEETEDALRRRVAPRQINDRAQDPYDAVRAYQKLLDKVYAK